jgi:hypothetical protein
VGPSDLFFTVRLPGFTSNDFRGFLTIDAPLLLLCRRGFALVVQLRNAHAGRFREDTAFQFLEAGGTCEEFLEKQ